MMVPVPELASTLRSKNAGIDMVSFDVIIKDPEVYEYIKSNECITAENILEAFEIESDRLELFEYYDPAKALTFTIRRRTPSGNPGDSDVLGSQQYAPLFEIDIDLPDEVDRFVDRVD